MSRSHVIVIGGGLAGMSCALDLADEGMDVTLLEARPRLGGATWSLERDGLHLDNGQHVFMRCCTSYIAFLERLGVTDRTELQPRLSVPIASPDGRRARLARNGLPAPLHLAGSLLTFPFLGPVERVRAGLAARAIDALDLDDDSIDSIAFGDFLRAHGQSNEAIRAFWDLYVIATLNAPCDDVSLSLAAKVYKTGLLESAGAADIGWSRIPLQQLHAIPVEAELDSLGARVLRNTPVRAISEPSAGAFRVHLEDGELACDAVIVASPHQTAAKILPAAAGVDAAALEALATSAIVNLHIVVDRPVIDEPFTATIDSPLQFVFDRTDSSGLQKGQCLAVSLSAADELLSLSREELRARFVPELERVFPAARSARIEAFHVTREPRATFRQSPGTRRLRPGTLTRLPGLYLAGAWTDTGWPATMEGAVRSGIAAARAAVRELRSGAAVSRERSARAA